MDDNILKLLRRPDYAPSNIPELLRRLGLRPNDQQALQQDLRRLEKTGRLLRTKGNRYILANQANLVPGILRITRQGRGFLQPDDPALQEIVVEESATATAMHGDRVLVRRDVQPAARRPADSPINGTVVRVLERKRSHIVGTLQREQTFLFVIPDDPRIPHDIYVRPPRDTGRPGQYRRQGRGPIAQAWESRHTNPEGEIIEVLGPAGREGRGHAFRSCANTICRSHFPKKALHEAGRHCQAPSARPAAPGRIARPRRLPRPLRRHH